MTKKLDLLSIFQPKNLLAFAALLSMFFIMPSNLVLAATSGCNNPNPSQCPQNQNSSLKDNPIVDDINVVVNFLSIGVGVVVIAMIIIGGIQYSAAGDNPQALTAAKQRIINALIALAAFLFIFAFLQWLIPGGVF